MNRQAICALGVALAVAVSAHAQQQPELAPLVPPKAPWLQKQEEKKKAPPRQAKKVRRKKAPAAPAPQKPVEAQLPLTPLVPASPGQAPVSITPSHLGMLFLDQAGLPPEKVGKVVEALRRVMEAAPLTRSRSVVKPPEPACSDDSCLFGVGAAEKLDQLLVVTAAPGGLHARVLDVARKKQISEGARMAPEDVVVEAEVLGCRLLVPAGCTGEIAVQAAEGVSLELDGAPLASGEKRSVPIGAHQLTARAGGLAKERTISVPREGAPALHALRIDGQPQILTGAELKARPAPAVSTVVATPVPPPAATTQAPAAAVSTGPAAPASRTRWTRPAGIAALAVGGAAALTGAILGAKSRSDLDAAESSFRKNGGAWRAADLEKLSSGNSSAKAANGLFIASAVLLAAGATLTFAF